MADAVQKIRVAVEARPDKDFLIVARTDARYAHGLDEALRRGEALPEAGTDILFVESPESLEELRRVAETLKGALLLAKMVEGGRTPYLDTTELTGLGFSVALFADSASWPLPRPCRRSTPTSRKPGSAPAAARPCCRLLT